MFSTIFNSNPEDSSAVVIISLRESIDRREAMIAHGVNRDWVENYLPATDGRAFDRADLATHCDIDSFKNNYNRLPSGGELGCALSHRMIYKEIINREIPLCLVFEDDTILQKGIEPALIDLANSLKLVALKEVSFICNIGLPINYIRNHHLRPVYLKYKFKLIKTKFLKLYRKKEDIWWANAYFISNAAARNILNSEKAVSLLADDWKRRHLRGVLDTIFVTSHPYASQDNRSASTIEETRRIVSQVTGAETHPKRKSLIDKARRTIGQYNVAINRKTPLIIKVN